MDPRHILFLLLINLIWGTTPIVLKLGFGEIPPFLMTSIRFALVSALLLPFTRWQRDKMGLILSIGLLAGPLQFGLGYWALSITDQVAPLAIASQLGVPFATFLSILFLGEHVGWRRWTGLGLAFGGTVIMMLAPNMSPDLDAVAIQIVAALFGSVSLILMRRVKSVAVFDLQAWIAHCTWPALFVCSLAFESGQGSAITEAGALTWLSITFTVFATSLVAHAGFYAMVQRYEISRLTPFLLIAPVFTVFLSALVLHNPLTARMLFGAVLTLIGVGIVMLRQGEVPAAQATQ